MRDGRSLVHSYENQSKIPIPQKSALQEPGINKIIKPNRNFWLNYK